MSRWLMLTSPVSYIPVCRDDFLSLDVRTLDPRVVVDLFPGQVDEDYLRKDAGNLFVDTCVDQGILVPVEIEVPKDDQGGVKLDAE